MNLSEEHLEKIEKEAKMFCQQNGIKYPKSFYPGTKIVVKHLIKFILSDPELLSKAGWVKKEKWISVKDSRKPLTEDDILVSDGIFVNMGYAIGSNFYINNEQATVQDEAKITHWQPLPPPPPQNK